MVTSEHEMESDPITAALPPNSDYMTYLTILEYQLTPERLPTLTGHLAQDDGTLAREIGWDLVKLVLPLLNAAPKDAARCLEVVARRGNPREVVVRVAEALEILGADDGDVESESDLEAGSNALPTFEGEAQRMHLGEMKLQGMPPPPERSSKLGNVVTATEQTQDAGDTPAALTALGPQFSTLLSMLALLHPRIKTQYPSRFLATSLPAALGAYRRIPITSETTTSFADLLGKLSGKQRPILPPRSSTANVTKVLPAKTTGTEISAPLPDPEGLLQENAKAPTELEMSIVLRLLQAVTLEVLEEYLLADSSTMEWAARLLERRSPEKTIPNRKSRSKSWEDDPTLISRDGMVDQFLRLAKDLGLDAEDVFRSTNLPPISDQEGPDVMAESSVEHNEDEAPSEFPTSPTQIPYSHLGALFLFLASKVRSVIYSDDMISLLDISTPDLHHFVNQFVIPTPTFTHDTLIPSVVHSQHTALDSLLAFLLLTKFPPRSPINTSVPGNIDVDYKSLIDILCYFSAEHPDPSFRTSAHHLATNLLHIHPSPTFRLAIIKSTMTDCGPFENLKEVAIGWLKEEILATVTTTSNSEAAAREFNNNEENVFASPTLFAADDTLCSLLFPEPATTDSSPPETNQTLVSASNPITQTLPIASLNLLYLLLTNPTLNARYHDLASQMTSSSSLSPSLTTTTTTTTSSSHPQPLAHRARTFLTHHQTYIDAHAGMTGSKEAEGRLALLAMAVGRVLGALQGWTRDRERERDRDAKGGKVWAWGMGGQAEGEMETGRETEMKREEAQADPDTAKGPAPSAAE